MAACSKVSERGESAGATPTTASGATVERAAARLVQQVRLMIASFFFSSSIVGYNCRSAKTLRQVDGAEASRGVKPL